MGDGLARPVWDAEAGAVVREPTTTLEVARDGYPGALEHGRAFYPRLRIGRPGRARTYWPMVAVLRALRARWAVRVVGKEHVAPGAGILIANHVSALDPVTVVMSTWWRVTAFTKIEAFESRGGFFFRIMGQIPLRRGDEAASNWALGMATRALQRGGKIGLYPEGTRSPDASRLHKLHKRIMVPLLQANPDVPVHAITTSYTRRGWLRTRVQVRISPRLSLDPANMTAEELTAAVRDALLQLGGQTYVDRYARDVKKDREPPRGS